MKMSEIRDLNDQELMESISEKQLELTRMRMNNVISPIENPQAIKATRRVVARLLTEKNRRDRQAQPAS